MRIFHRWYSVSIGFEAAARSTQAVGHTNAWRMAELIAAHIIAAKRLLPH
ncbi:hypothetical protein [Pararhizobium sp.]